MKKTKLYCEFCKKEITNPYAAEGCKINGHRLIWKPKIILKAGGRLT